MKQLIIRLKNHNVHDRKLAIARSLFALGMLLTLIVNDASLLTSHDYHALPHPFRPLHTRPVNGVLESLDLFMLVSPSVGKAISIAVLLLVISGYWPKLSGILHVWVCYSIRNYFLILNGGDATALVFVVLLLPLCLTDPRTNQWQRPQPGKPKINIVANIALYAIKLQAAMAYFDAGYTKMQVRHWRDGSALYYYTSVYAPGSPGWLQRITELFTTTALAPVLSWAVIVFELLLAACLFVPKRVKRTFLIVGLLFHFANVILYGIPSFFCSMAGVLILYLYDTDHSVSLPERLFSSKKLYKQNEV